MTQEIDLHRLFVIVFGPFGIFQTGLVHTGIANETINGFRHSEFIQVLAKLANRIKGIEFTDHGSEVI